MKPPRIKLSRRLDENYEAERMSDALAMDAFERRGGGW